jgi:hypothetical protein
MATLEVLAIELELPWSIGKIEERAARRFHRLQFACVNCMEPRVQRFFIQRDHDTAEPLFFTDRAHLPDRHQNEIIGTGEPLC